MLRIRLGDRSGPFRPPSMSIGRGRGENGIDWPIANDDVPSVLARILMEEDETLWLEPLETGGSCGVLVDGVRLTERRRLLGTERVEIGPLRSQRGPLFLPLLLEGMEDGLVPEAPQIFPTSPALRAVRDELERVIHIVSVAAGALLASRWAARACIEHAAGSFIDANYPEMSAIEAAGRLVMTDSRAAEAACAAIQARVLTHLNRTKARGEPAERVRRALSAIDAARRAVGFLIGRESTRAALIGQEQTNTVIELGDPLFLVSDWSIAAANARGDVPGLAEARRQLDEIRNS